MAKLEAVDTGLISHWGHPQSQPYAVKTTFGWSIAGPAEKDDGCKSIALSVFQFGLQRNMFFTNKD